MGKTTKRWKTFWDRRRSRKAEKLRHLDGRTRPSGPLGTADSASTNWKGMVGGG
jgi:hypothetical protein